MCSMNMLPSHQSTAHAPWSCALPNLWEPRDAGVSVRRCSCGARHIARAASQILRAGGGISLDADSSGDVIKTILGWDQLHGCPATFAGVFVPWEQKAQQETRSIEETLQKDTESRQVSASWKASVRQGRVVSGSYRGQDCQYRQ